MTLEELIALQKAWGLTHVHIVELGPTDWRLAHTDMERAAGTNNKPCPFHQWLSDRPGPPAPAGLYVITAEPWELHRLQSVG